LEAIKQPINKGIKFQGKTLVAHTTVSQKERKTQKQQSGKFIVVNYKQGIVKFVANNPVIRFLCPQFVINI
jgi:hypothetical protein